MYQEIFKNIESFTTIITEKFSTEAILILVLTGIGWLIKNKITSSQEKSKIELGNSHKENILKIEKNHEISKEISKEIFKKRLDTYEKIKAIISNHDEEKYIPSLEDIYGDEASEQSREEEIDRFFNTIRELNSTIKENERYMTLGLSEVSNALSESYGKYIHDYRLMEDKYDELEWSEHWSSINDKHFPEVFRKFNIFKKEFKSELDKRR
jgi:hypothetical protein